MTDKKLLKAIAAYEKTGNIKPLSRSLVTMLVYMFDKAGIGFEMKFIHQLPALKKKLKEINIR